MTAVASRQTFMESMRPPSTVGIANAHDPCSNLANAHRLLEHADDRLLFVQSLGWHTWAPPWRLDDLGAKRIAHQLGRLIAIEAAGLADAVANAPNPDERKRRQDVMERRFKWASRSESRQSIENALRLAEPLMTCTADQLDSNPSLLGLPGGVLDLDTLKQREHRPLDRITKVTGCDFDEHALAPRWLAFVDEILGSDGELFDYIQKLCGYSLSGERGDHLLPIFYGSGANGKSVFLGTLQAALGDYAGVAAPGLLITRGGTEHPTGLASLQGKRLVVASETGEGGRLNEEQAKLLTGGDRITARRMRQDFYDFSPTHLLILQTNHRPRVTGTDEGLWRRVRLLPFSVTIPADKRDPKLMAKLKDELPGIFAWFVRGLQRYRAEGFNEPASVRAATAEYRDASDQVGAFIDECCDHDGRSTTSAADLYTAYSRWAERSGERPRSKRDFGIRLDERGIERARTNGERRWRGLKLLRDVSDASDPFSGLSSMRGLSQGAHGENSGDASPCVTDYRRARG